MGKGSKEKGVRLEVGGILVIEVRGALRLRLEAKRIGNWEFRLWKETPVKCSRGAQVRFADFCEILSGAGRLKGESLCYLALLIFLYVSFSNR